MNKKQKGILIDLLKSPRKLCCFILQRYLSSFIKDDAKYISWYYLLSRKKKINLEVPVLFQEKLQWLKLNNRREEYTQMVDKYEAKKYVASIIGDEYIIPTIGVWNDAEDINIDELPDRFVLKCTHDSGRVHICKDKSLFDFAYARQRLNETLHKSYYMRGREYPYKNVKHRIIAEKYMSDGEAEELKDYKFFCFNGRAEYCQVIQDRSSNETIDFYDRNWIHQEFVGLNPNVSNSNFPIEKPYAYQQMVCIADKLAETINSPFVRIDLYNIGGKIYFGEITFFPNSGFGTFKPDKWNQILGKKIVLLS